jgi:hypothetical protein
MIICCNNLFQAQRHAHRRKFQEGKRTTSGSEFDGVEGEGSSGPLMRSYRLWAMEDVATAEVCYESRSKSIVSVLTLPRYPFVTTPDS